MPIGIANNTCVQLNRIEMTALNFRYRADIDGLRALAVLSVLLFHLELAFPGGFVGVDVFFVISGYLITGLILRDQASSEFKLSRFWVRRILRIVPAASVMVLVTLLAGCYFLLPSELRELAQSAVFQQLMVSNVFFWKQTGYFDGPADLKPLLHTWSLAVEEQFYLGYPWLLVLLAGMRRTSGARILLAISILSFGISFWGTIYKPSAAFFLLPTRAWEMLVGALICYSRDLRTRLVSEAAGLLGLIGVVLACWMYDSSTGFPGAAALLPCMGGALVIYSGNAHNTIVSRVLSSSSLVFVGRISYSLYLWHWPILAYVRVWTGDELSIVQALFVMVASIIVAWASWRYVELPFRAQAGRVGATRSTFRRALLSATVLILASTVIWMSGGLPGRVSQELWNALDDTTWTGTEYLASQRTDEDSQLPLLGSSPVPSVMVWGDSHALAYVEAIDLAARKQGVSVLMGVENGIPPIPGLSFPDDPERDRRMRERSAVMLRAALDPRIKLVILVSRWSSRVEGRNDYEVERLRQNRNDTLVGNNSKEALEALELRGSELVRRLVAAGKRVCIIRQVPEVETPVSAELLRHARFGVDLGIRAVDADSHGSRQKRVNAVLDRIALCGATEIDPAEYLIEDGLVVQVHGNRAVYRDTNHLSRFGAEAFMKPIFEHVLSGI